jgi:hypothetical protein
MEAVNKTPEPGKVLNMEFFDGGMNTVISILTKDISAAWKNITEWQRDMSHTTGRPAYKIHSYTITPITMNSPLMPQGVPAMLIVVIMEKVSVTVELPSLFDQTL